MLNEEGVEENNCDGRCYHDRWWSCIIE